MWHWKSLLIFLYVACLSLNAAAVEVTVQKGDTLTGVLKKTKLSDFEMKQWLYASDLVKVIGQIAPGDKIKLVNEANDMQLIYCHSSGRVVKFLKLADGTVIVDQPSDIRPVKRAFKSFSIKHSLTVDGKAAGVSYNLLQAMADIYAWEMDFSSALKFGDQVQIITEQRELGGGYWSPPEIVYAKIAQKNKDHEAMRYVDENEFVGYYNPKGQSLIRSFLRHPVKYTRISSPFSLHRQHPVFGGSRPHSGVDLAAKRGSPVWATSTGKVIFSGTRGGYGKAVIIKHGSRVSTLYAHLDRIGPEIKKGALVSAKQVIGYVGSTGVATGPHLHYEFRIDNQPKDPMAIDLPRSKPLVGMAYLKMLAERQQWLAMAMSEHDYT
ncbi:peptidoglycan DD-metalloendopeptidase family protein [Gammaproteobacteria bacterium]|nr:peptidoglycan DD-metalloendopeptidase family protein [Gammaproteobacteria bacterium]